MKFMILIIQNARFSPNEYLAIRTSAMISQISFKKSPTIAGFVLIREFTLIPRQASKLAPPPTPKNSDTIDPNGAYLHSEIDLNNKKYILAY